MPVIRFLREGRDVECYPGENLREVALREGVELYGLKGKLGNCGGCGQCITCFVEVVEATPGSALSDRTAVEEQKLRRRPQNWRLACQALVQESLVVLTRPQIGLPDREAAVVESCSRPLPEGPTSWPELPGDSEPGSDKDGLLALDAVTPGDGRPEVTPEVGNEVPGTLPEAVPSSSATSDEGGAGAADRR
jgi:ferredoxin